MYSLPPRPHPNSPPISLLNAFILNPQGNALKLESPEHRTLHRRALEKSFEKKVYWVEESSGEGRRRKGLVCPTKDDDIGLFHHL